PRAEAHREGVQRHRPDSNRRITVLQTAALPLGYGAFPPNTDKLRQTTALVNATVVRGAFPYLRGRSVPQANGRCEPAGEVNVGELFVRTIGHHRPAHTGRSPGGTAVREMHPSYRPSRRTMRLLLSCFVTFVVTFIGFIAIFP